MRLSCIETTSAEYVNAACSLCAHLQKIVYKLYKCICIIFWEICIVHRNVIGFSKITVSGLWICLAIGMSPWLISTTWSEGGLGHCLRELFETDMSSDQ